MSEQLDENHLHTFCQLTSQSIVKENRKSKKRKMEIDEKLKGKRDELLFNFRDKRTKRCPNSICLHAAAAGNGSGSRLRHVYVINAAKHLNLTLLHLPMNMSTKSAEHTQSRGDSSDMGGRTREDTRGVARQSG